MRITWSTRRVFAVVAAGWMALGALTRVAYVTTPSHVHTDAITDPLSQALLFPVIPLLSDALNNAMNSSAICPGHSGSVLCGWVVWTGPILAVCALIWATLITSAYVLVRHLRDRRAASKAV